LKETYHKKKELRAQKVGPEFKPQHNNNNKKGNKWTYNTKQQIRAKEPTYAIFKL
jgi:hypothetical protein